MAPDSINFCVLGRKETAREFGKPGTSSDITIHDRKGRDAVKTWVTATGFPDKIQPLFQAINMSEHVIFHVDALDRFTGEQIIALDVLGRKKGILCHAYEVDADRLESMIRGTVVENYDRVEIPELAGAVGAVKDVQQAAGNNTQNGYAEVAVDHSFDVKGVGTVILGRVTVGTIRQYDKMLHCPSGTEVLIKSIQMHDDPTDVAIHPARVGLAVKGIKPDDMQRGDIISTDMSKDGQEVIAATSNVTLDYTPNRFCKMGMTEGQGCIVATGLQARAATITGIKDDANKGKSHTLSLKFANPIAYHIGDTAVILRPEASPVRIAGSGSIVSGR